MIPLATLLFWRKATGLAACIGVLSCHADLLAHLKFFCICGSLAACVCVTCLSCSGFLGRTSSNALRVLPKRAHTDLDCGVRNLNMTGEVISVTNV